MDNKESYCIRTYYKITKLSMLLIGQWPYQTKNLANILTSIWIFQHISIFIPEIIKLVEIRNDVDYVIESFSPIIYNIGLGIKYLNGIYNKNKIKTILDRIQNDWSILSDKSEVKILEKYTSFGRFISTGYFYMCFSTLTLYLLLPCTPFVLDIVKPLNESRPKVPIYLVELFVDEKEYFFEILAHSYITTVIGFTAIIATDTFYANSVQHACGMLSILGRRLRKINIQENVDMNKSNDNYEEIVNCAKQHNKILKFCEYINGTYSDSFFFIMGLNMIIMSFSGVLTILKWGRYYDMIRLGMFTGAQMFHLFYYSLQGQYLLTQSLTISDCVYQSGWYTASPRTRKIMAIMIMRSLKPLQLTAKILILSLPNFTIVMKTSMSYFTVLKSSRTE